jgi:cytochrome oxidase Cu insertion factor (SCO1/SenC/PrrC family)
VRPATRGSAPRAPAAATVRTRAAGRRRVFGAALAGVAVAVLAVVATGGWRSHRTVPPGAPADYGLAPDYVLTDQHGQQFASAALRGKIQVVSYLFPYCTSFCPLLAGTLAQAERLADGAGLAGTVAFVAFNVDPEHAGPDTLAAFLRQEGLNPNDPAWHFLTGSPTAVRRVITGGFHVSYDTVSRAEEEKIAAEQRAGGDYTPQPTAPNRLAERVRPDYDIVHNDVVEIVDGDGRIRAIFASGSPPTPDEIVSAIRQAGATTTR